jgi:hypothetical protein
LECDLENQAAGALESAEAKNKSGLKKFKPDSLFQTGINWKEQTGSIGFNLIDDKDKDFGPWPKTPKPLPGYLAWLGFQTKLTLAGRLPVALVVDGSAWGTPEQKTVIKVASQGKEKGKFDIKFAMMIRAMWSYAGDAIAESMKEGQGKTPILDTFKDVLEYIDVELTLTPSITNEFSFGWGAEWTKTTFKPEKIDVINSFLSNLTTVIHAQASVFEWNYDTIKGTLLNGGTDYGVYLENMNAFGVDFRSLRGTWGKSKYDEYSYLTTVLEKQEDRNQEIVIGSRIEFHFGYASDDEAKKTKFAIQFRAHADSSAASNVAQGGVVDLVSDLSVVDVPPKGGVGRGELKYTTKLSWSDLRPADEDGGGYFRNLNQKKRAALVNFFQTCKNEKKFSILPQFKVPPNDRATGALSPKSSLIFAAPIITDYSAVLKQGAAPELLWLFHIQNYLDTHIWIQLKEHDSVERDDTIVLKGRTQNNWKLIKISGNGPQNGKMMISIPLSDIEKITDKEDVYQFYLRIGLLDDDSCCIHTSKEMIEVPKGLLKGVG